MNSKSRFGVLYIGQEAFPATVTLRVLRSPSSPVGRQQVEVEFHERQPKHHKLVIAGEMTFTEDAGADYLLQYGGIRWTLRNAEDFLK